MKKILLIAYHFHPDTAIGALRTIKYAKYLPQFGWDPQILTIHEHLYPAISKNSLDFDVPIHRTGVWPVPDDIYRKIKKSFELNNSENNKTISVDEEKSSSRESLASNSEESRPPFLHRLVNSLSGTPDPQVGWLVPGVRKACALIRENKFDLIYTSGPPHSTHLIGLQAHRRTGVPWVLDFRDPWHFDQDRDIQLVKWSIDFDRRYERISVESASLVITTTDEWRDRLKERHSPYLDQKCHTIINGFDESDFRSFHSLIPKKTNDRIVFFHGGTLYMGRDPSGLLQAAGELIHEGKLDKNKVLFQFYGRTDIDMRLVHEMISRFDLTSIVRFADPVQREQYMRLLAASDVLMLFQSDITQICIPAKTFEYLATGKQILNISNAGATRNFLSNFSQASSAGPKDVQEIKKSLIKLTSKDSRIAACEKLGETPFPITKEKLTERFVTLLDNVVKTRTGA